MKPFCKLSSVKQSEELLLPFSSSPEQEIIRLLKGLQEDGKAILVAQTTCNKTVRGEDASVSGWGGPFTVRFHTSQPVPGAFRSPNTPQNTSLICDGDLQSADEWSSPCSCWALGIMGVLST